jgi:hypothetical protein
MSGKREKGDPRRDGDDRALPAVEQMRGEGIDRTDRAEDVDVDGGLGVGDMPRVAQILDQHDAGHRHHDVQVGVSRHYLVNSSAKIVVKQVLVPICRGNPGTRGLFRPPQAEGPVSQGLGLSGGVIEWRQSRDRPVLTLARTAHPASPWATARPRGPSGGPAPSSSHAGRVLGGR